MQHKPRPLAFSYLRVSSGEQARKGVGIQRQIDASKAWAEQHGFELDDTLRDLGRSAFKEGQQTALISFKERVISGEIPRGSTLIVESLDRLSRASVLRALSQFTNLIEQGITIVTLIDGRTYSADSLNEDWTQLIITLAIFARASDESSTKSSRIHDVWNRRRERAAQKPMTGTRPAWLDWDGTRFVANPVKAAVVRRIFTEVAEQGCGLEVMSRRLNREGVPLLHDRPGEQGWTNNRVLNVLRSPSAYGELTPKRRLDGTRDRAAAGEPIAGYYPAVVSRELFLRAARAREENRGQGGPKTNCVANMLTGRIHCAECGGKVRIRTARTRSNSYVCDNAFRRLGCTNRHFNAVHWIEKGVMDGVLMFRFIKEPPRHNSPQAVALREEMALLMQRLEEGRPKLQRLVDLLADDPIPAMATKVREMSTQIEAWEARKAEVDGRLRSAEGQATYGDMIQAVEAMREAAYSPVYHDREAARGKLSLVLRQAVDDIRIGEDKVASVAALKGLVQFQITAGELHSLVFNVDGTQWQLMPDLSMQPV